jgi:multidrug efflux system membrane fusion protein
MHTRIAVLILTASLLVASCGGVQGKDAAPLRPVRVTDVRTVELGSRPRYAVTIAPDLEVPVAFKVSGYIESIPERRGADGQLRPLQQGDMVQAGSRLALIRTAEYRERVNQARSSVAEAEALHVKASRDWERARILFDSQSLTRPDYDAAAASYESARARVSALTAEAELASLAFADASLEAPFTGLVLERRIEVGNLVSGGTVAFRLARVTPVKALFGVPDSLVGRIATGMTLEITSESLTNEVFTGQVTAIAPAADRDAHIFNVEVTLSNNDGRLKPGMIGAVEIEPRPTDTARLPAVPLNAIVRSNAGNDDYAVFVAERDGDVDIVRSRPVRLGAAVGNMMTVTAGLRNGDRVVTMGAGLVHDGEPVRVIR